MRRVLITSSLFLLTVSSFASGKEQERFRKVVGRMIKAINVLDYKAIGKDYSKIMRDAFPLEKRGPFFKNLIGQFGKIQKLDPPRLMGAGIAVFVAHCERGQLDIKIILNNKDEITGLWFLPHRPEIPAPARNETPLRLPFEGQWQTFWGGDSEELNQHHGDPGQRFAFDFFPIDDNGKSYRGDGTSNEDYYAFGKDILAPADGVVTDVINGVRDNTPGSMNPYLAPGNAVLIQHSEHEVSVLAHLRLNSIMVRVGDKVKRGQVIGLCGNSGNSSQPHVHYHLQNTPVMQDAKGIKCYFQDVVLPKKDPKGKRKEYSPVKGDIVAPG